MSNIYVNTQVLNKDTREHITKDKLIVDQEVLIPHLTEFSFATVVSINNNEAWAEDAGSVWFFKYEEKYGRWLNELGINKKVLEAMEKWNEKPKLAEQTD